MVVIEEIRVAKGRRLRLNGPDHPDLALFKDGSFTPYDPTILYDLRSGQTTERPAAFQKEEEMRSICLKVKVSGISTDLFNKNWSLRLETSRSEPYWFESDAEKPSGDTHEFTVSERRMNDVNWKNPWCLRGKIQFNLYIIEPDGTILRNFHMDSVPMELYILGWNLPAYLEPGIPLLLLRLFVCPATKKRVKTTDDWLALVVGICHGSASPIDGEPTKTEDHWLKYDTFTGSCHFVSENRKNPKPIGGLNAFYNYGGCFELELWLDAYRGFKKNKKLTLVNCYDQAGAVEVAASLGMDHNNIAWEYHQTYGYIAKDTKLVGWGECNNPYFREKTELKVVSNEAMTDDGKFIRRPFTNHAFLSWHPEFHPDYAFWEKKTDPSKYDVVKMRAIDACAGPHLGNEERGIWEDPANLQHGSNENTKNKTYWRTRDDQYPHDPHAWQSFDKKKNIWEDHVKRHFWTPGITRLLAKGEKEKEEEEEEEKRKKEEEQEDEEEEEGDEEEEEDPFEGSGIAFPTVSDFPESDVVLGESLSDLQEGFKQSLESIVDGSAGWCLWRSSDIDDKNNRKVLREVKIWDPKEPAFNYAALRISVLPSLADALDAQEARAKQIVLTSTFEAGDFETPAVDPSHARKIHILQADYISLLMCVNLMIEISGYSGKDIIKTLARNLAKRLEDFPTVESSQWRQILV